MTNIQPLAPTDKQLEDFAVEEQFLLFCDADEFTQIARAVLAKWGTQPVAREPLSDEEVDSLCKVGFVYVIDGKVTRTPTQYRDELKAAQRYGLRKGEHAHGIKGGQHGTE